MTYIDTAEDLTEIVQTVLEKGPPYPNATASICQNICEMYLMYLIGQKVDVYDTVPTNILYTHRLDLFIDYMYKELGIEFDKDFILDILSINNYYIYTRYPSKEYIKLSDHEIERCASFIAECRDVIMKKVDELNS